MFISIVIKFDSIWSDLKKNREQSIDCYHCVDCVLSLGQSKPQMLWLTHSESSTSGRLSATTLLILITDMTIKLINIDININVLTIGINKLLIIFTEIQSNWLTFWYSFADYMLLTVPHIPVRTGQPCFPCKWVALSHHQTRASIGQRSSLLEVMEDLF